MFEYITFTGSMKNIIISCAYLNTVSSYDMDVYDNIFYNLTLLISCIVLLPTGS